MEIICAPCAPGDVLPLAPDTAHTLPCHHTQARPLPAPPMAWPVGTRLLDATGTALFSVVGRLHLPTATAAAPHAAHGIPCPLLRAERHITAGAVSLGTSRSGWALGWITLSDKGYAGEREDTSGPALAALLRDTLPLCHEQGFLLPDDARALRSLMAELALGQGYDLVCTTGGTGLAPRDISPDVTLSLLDTRLPGFEQAMMQASLAKTPMGCVSRAVAGVIGSCICVNLPGSRKAVTENLTALLPALNHALEKLHGDPSDCGT